MSYERLKRQIEGIKKDFIRITAQSREESIKRDTTLFQTVQKQGLYLETFLEYDRRFWFLPRGLFIGRKIFTAIFNRKAQEMEAELLEAGKEALKEQTEKVKKMREEKDANETRILKPGDPGFLEVIDGG